MNTKYKVGDEVAVKNEGIIEDCDTISEVTVNGYKLGVYGSYYPERCLISSKEITFENKFKIGDDVKIIKTKYRGKKGIINRITYPFIDKSKGIYEVIPEGFEGDGFDFLETDLLNYGNFLMKECLDYLTIANLEELLDKKRNSTKTSKSSGKK